MTPNFYAKENRMSAVAELRPELEPLPPRLKSLPVHRGYPVPWFVAWVDGVPEFRCMDGEKFRDAILRKLCWVCGEPLGKRFTFVSGPMCGINRTSAEPPSHRDCAQWSVRNCPFLSKPHMVRRENDMPESEAKGAGFMIRRNPGVTLLWTTSHYQPFNDGRGGVLIEMGLPAEFEWWAEGKPASRAQIEASVSGGLPILLEMAEKEGPAAVAELAKRRQWLETIYPT